MYWCSATPKPISVAFSLAIYFAERNSGDFKNHFITFSCNPQLVEIKGKDIYEKVKYCETFAECANTDIQAVFDLVLSTAVKNKTLPEDMPSNLYIISDMEFDIVRKILMLQILNTQRKSLNRTDMLCLKWCFGMLQAAICNRL